MGTWDIRSNYQYCLCNYSVDEKTLIASVLDWELFHNNIELWLITDKDIKLNYSLTLPLGTGSMIVALWTDINSCQTSC